MPHCIIEYAQDVERRVPVDRLLEAVHQGALASGLFREEDIKTRALSYRHYRVGRARTDFVHVTVRLLSGRTAEQRAALSQSVLNALQGLGLTMISLTVEVQEIERESYAKAVVGGASE